MNQLSPVGEKRTNGGRGLPGCLSHKDAKVRIGLAQFPLVITKAKHVQSTRTYPLRLRARSQVSTPTQQMITISLKTSDCGLIFCRLPARRFPLG